jgi:hypothetical protein
MKTFGWFVAMCLSAVAFALLMLWVPWQAVP